MGPAGGLFLAATDVKQRMGRWREAGSCWFGCGAIRYAASLAPQAVVLLMLLLLLLLLST